VIAASQRWSLVPATLSHSRPSRSTPVAAASASVACTWASAIVCVWRWDHPAADSTDRPQTTNLPMPCLLDATYRRVPGQDELGRQPALPEVVLASSYAPPLLYILLYSVRRVRLCALLPLARVSRFRQGSTWACLRRRSFTLPGRPLELVPIIPT
jgi:hypothetical protein